MYQIFADDTLIYDDESEDKRFKLLSPKLSLADSSAGSLTMTVPPGNAGYDVIVRMKTDITVKKEGEIYWQGRVLQENKDFWNQRVLTCEGDLAFLNDTIQPPTEYHLQNGTVVRRFLSALLTNHNSKVEPNRQFTLGAVTVEDPNDTLYRYTNYETTMTCIKEKLYDKLGGHLVIRHENGVRIIDYLEESVNLNTQTVNFGKNLIDFTRSFDSAEYATVIVPLGERLDKEEGDPEALEKYLTVESVNGGSIYVQSDEAVSSYGWIVKVVHWDDVTVASNLLSKARAYLRDLQFDTMVIELSALDLHYLNPDIESVKLGDSIRVISEPHGLDRIFPVQKMEIPLDKPENTLFTLGTEVRTSLTAENSKTNAQLKEKIDSIETEQASIDVDTILEEAQDNAAALMDLKMNGYVTLETSTTGGEHLEAIYISDTKPLRTSGGSFNARRFWRWSLNGLAYNDNYGSSDGWKVAIGMDGLILGERIAAGSIHGNRITTGTLTLVTSAGDTGCQIYLRSVEGSTITTITSANIQINGMVTFAKLNDPDTTSGGSRTFIDGGHIRAETMDLSSLRVREVWYYDPTDMVDYKVFESYLDGTGHQAPVFINIGPKDRTYDAGYYMNLFAHFICFGYPGVGDDLLHDRNALIFNVDRNLIYTNGNSGSTRWRIGTEDLPFQQMYAFEFGVPGAGYYTDYRGAPAWWDGYEYRKFVLE